jgi:hypothetical protein
LGDKVEARVAVLERRSDADGCVGLALGGTFVGNTGLGLTYQL